MSSFTKLRTFLLTVLLAVLPLSVLANKPHTADRHLEMNNLASDATYRTANAKIAQESGVIRYLYNVKYGPMFGTAEMAATE